MSSRHTRRKAAKARQLEKSAHLAVAMKAAARDLLTKHRAGRRLNSQEIEIVTTVYGKSSLDPVQSRIERKAWHRYVDSTELVKRG